MYRNYSNNIILVYVIKSVMNLIIAVILTIGLNCEFYQSMLIIIIERVGN